ncbi:unnamed protein product [Rotaria sp. Silwood2]|nr:unnamed protein product [Rotaria sp. Silwood2]CAF3856520.1 unnamed protein product [Rotaria sp. Silwood2]
MLRVIYLSRAQPAARNLLLINKRFQQTSTTSSTKPTSTNPSSATKTKTTSSSYPADSNTGGTVKAIVYGLGLGLSITLLYAEYDNGSFRRKVESKLPLSSTILSVLDKIIDPIFGRHKKLTTIISEKLPDVSPVTDRLPDKEQVKRAAEQAKDTINDTYDKLPEYKTVKSKIIHAADQVKDAAHAVRDALPDPKAVKKTLTHAKDQVEDTAKSITNTVKDALPATKGVSGEQSRRGNDPVFLEEPGEVATPPPIKPMNALLDGLPNIDFNYYQRMVLDPTLVDKLQGEEQRAQEFINLAEGEIENLIKEFDRWDNVPPAEEVTYELGMFFVREFNEKDDNDKLKDIQFLPYGKWDSLCWWVKQGSELLPHKHEWVMSDEALDPINALP